LKDIEESEPRWWQFMRITRMKVVEGWGESKIIEEFTRRKGVHEVRSKSSLNLLITALS
jgi:hypothetical protein